MLEVKKDVDLSHLLWYKLGGTCKYLLVCRSEEDIQEALEYIANNDIKRTLTIGLGSNLIFADDYFDGAVIEMKGDASSFKITDDCQVECFSGETLDSLIQFAFEHNLAGLEWAGGLPGTVGAAVRGNVGAFGSEIKDSFEKASVASLRNGKREVTTMSNTDMNFSYRESKVKEDGTTILNATFILTPVSSEEIEKAKEVYRKNIQHRKDRHPLEYPNCGSVFKNIREKEKVEKILEVYPDIQDKVKTDWHGKVAVGYLIQKMGLQGYRVGNAQISEKHALFIVNLGGAKAQDVITIINHIQEKFIEKFGFSLEIEPEIID